MPIINQIVKGGGTTPTGTKSITANGIYDVTTYASADVQVPTTAPASYRAFQKDANGKLVNSTSTPWVPLPAGTTDLDDYVFCQAYKNTPANILSGAIDLSSLTTLSGSQSLYNCFQNCNGITSVNLSNLVTISGINVLQCCFQGCTGITGLLDLSSLTTISSSAMSYCFQNCTGIISVDLSSLTTVSGNAALGNCFQNCTGITSVTFSALTTLNSMYAMSNCFGGCTGLTSLSFPALTSTSFGSNTNQFNNMLAGVTGCTIHFPSNVQAKVETLTGYPNFGGTNTVVLFDLPATE